VVREIDGATVRYIERVAPDQLRALKNGEVADLTFSDCAITVEPEGSATGDVVITGVSVDFPILEYTSTPQPFPYTSTDGGYYADGGLYGLESHDGPNESAGIVTLNNVSYAAAAAGVQGNLISVAHVLGTGAPGVESVSVSGNAITVVFGAGTTIAQVITAVNAHAPAAALVTALSYGGSTALPAVFFATRYLSGGISTGNWKLSFSTASSVWLADSTEALPWNINPADWIAIPPATGTPVITPAEATIAGLEHLEGEQVTILADGSVHRPLTVSGGEITLDYSVTKAVIGMPYTATLEPTWLESPDVASFSKAGKKRIHRIITEMWKTAGTEISVDNGVTWKPMETRSIADRMDANRVLITGLREEFVGGSTSRQISCILRSRDPLPMLLQSLHIRYQIDAK
jgi:hypothetical protein